ncbi:MAG TPA: LD-carboxypeptidase [Clostridiales bacterium]|nr:LD-carboxypeptidase [Clostridiales bacterium]
MIYPNFLSKGQKIGVTAISDGQSKDVDYIRLDHAAKKLKDYGYLVVETKNVRTSVKGRSSHARIRANQLHQLFKDREVSVIMAASGGDFLVEALPYIDFDLIKNNPKWLQGFSDITGLSFVITTNLDIATIYSDNFGTFGMDEWHPSLLENIKILEGEDIIQESFEKYQDGYFDRVTGLEGFVLNSKTEWRNITNLDESTEIELNGRALVGCLDILLNLVGTKFDKTKEFIQKYQNDGIIWFLESYNLSSEELIRGLWQLKHAGWFENTNGLVFGRPAMFSSYTDTSYDEAVLSVLGELNMPIILDADIGHKQPQFTMINGAIASIYSKDGMGSILFERR